MNKEKLRYAMLKQLQKNEEDVTFEKFGIENSEFSKEAKFLINENYIDNHMTFEGGDIIIFRNGYTYVTKKGEQYLKDNSLLGKSYKVAKEIRDWIK